MNQQLPVAGAPAVRAAVRDLLRADRGAAVAVLAINVLAAVAVLAAPLLIARIVDHVEADDLTVSTVDFLALAIVGTAVTGILLTRLARYLGHRFSERALARLREGFVDRTLQLPTSVVERAGTGDLMSRTTGDIALVGGAIRDALPEVFVGALQALFAIVALFVLDPLLGACGVVGFGGLWWVGRWYLRRARPAYLTEGATAADMSASLAATVDGARTVEAFRLGRRRVTDADRRIGAAFGARVATLNLRSVLIPWMEFLAITGTAIVLGVGGAGYLAGWVSLGSVVAGTLYAMQLAEPLNAVLMWMEQVQRGTASLARLKGIDEVPNPPAPGGTPRDDRIEVSDVHYAYTADRDVLHGVNLVVRPGERLAIVGPSGAGKSTLGRLLAGVDAPRRGSITVGGVPVADLTTDELRRRILLVTQEHHVFLGTVRDNLAIAAPDATDDELTRALTAVDADWVARLPDGLGTDLGAGGLRLDPAQAQQLALARVVLADPHTVILDEATAQLDPATARHAERALAAVLGGRTVIAIAHRLHTAHAADRVAVMDGGRITELGSHAELVAAGGAYASLWRSWHG
jgi:ATP-binding cassette, subfamily C, bacterial